MAGWGKASEVLAAMAEDTSQTSSSRRPQDTVEVERRTTMAMKGFKVFVSVYIRQLVHMGVLPEALDVMVVFRMMQVRHSSMRVPECMVILLSDLQTMVMARLKSLGAKKMQIVTCFQLLGMCLADHTILGHVRFELIRQFVECNAPFSVDDGGPTLKKLFLSGACHTLLQYRSLGDDPGNMLVDPPLLPPKVEQALREGLLLLPHLGYRPPGEAESPRICVIIHGAWCRILEVGMRVGKPQEGLSAAAAIKLMLQLMYAHLIEDLYIMAVCEQSRRNEPFCKLENLAQHAGLMQGFELPSCHAMHELWTDLEAAEQGLEGVHRQLVSVGMDSILAASYACLHIITAKRLGRSQGPPGSDSSCSEASQCPHCGTGDHISRPFAANVSLVVASGLVPLIALSEALAEVRPRWCGLSAANLDVWDAAGDDVMDSPDSLSLVLQAMEHHKMAPLTMYRHRGAVKQPQALMREVLRLKVAQMKEAAWLQLQQREPVIYQGALGDAPLSRRMFCTRQSRESETLQANDIANVAVHGIELTRAELASFHNTLKW